MINRTIDEVIEALTNKINELNAVPYKQGLGYPQREAEDLQVILDYVMGKRDTITD